MSLLKARCILSDDKRMIRTFSFASERRQRESRKDIPSVSVEGAFCSMLVKAVCMTPLHVTTHPEPNLVPRIQL